MRIDVATNMYGSNCYKLNSGETSGKVVTYRELICKSQTQWTPNSQKMGENNNIWHVPETICLEKNTLDLKSKWKKISYPNVKKTLPANIKLKAQL